MQPVNKSRVITHKAEVIVSLVEIEKGNLVLLGFQPEVECGLLESGST